MTDSLCYFLVHLKLIPICPDIHIQAATRKRSASDFRRRISAMALFIILKPRITELKVNPSISTSNIQFKFEKLQSLYRLY